MNELVDGMESSWENVLTNVAKNRETITHKCIDDSSSSGERRLTDDKRRRK